MARSRGGSVRGRCSRMDGCPLRLFSVTAMEQRHGLFRCRRTFGTFTSHRACSSAAAGFTVAAAAAVVNISAAAPIAVAQAAAAITAGTGTTAAATVDGEADGEVSVSACIYRYGRGTTRRCGRVTSELLAYPKGGQTEEQQARDRDGCRQWAADQSGFDPAKAQTAVTRDALAARQVTGAPRRRVSKDATTLLNSLGPLESVYQRTEQRGLFAG
jgi:hypothetical protein